MSAAELQQLDGGNSEEPLNDENQEIGSEMSRTKSQTATQLPEPVVKLTEEQKRRLGNELGLMEKAYTIGVLNFGISVFMLARYPQHFWILHCVKACIYLPWRFVRFSRNNWEWYMLEFCYFNAYFTVGCCFLAFMRAHFGIDNPLHPYNHSLIRAGYTFANGALLWAIVIWGNKIVFHDVDNLTTAFIHISPAMFFWALRWGGGFGTSVLQESWPDMFIVCPDMTAGDQFRSTWLSMFWHAGDCAGTVNQFVWFPMFVYVVAWALPYSIIVFGLAYNYMKRNGKYNVYFETIESDNAVAQLIKKLPRSLWPLGHMLVHFLWTTLSGFFATLMWNSFMLNTLVVVGLLLSMIHSGSTYTFRVVAAKQVTQLVAKVQAESPTAKST
eukprot:TRINITY_DN44248_c0_g1_i1.p1 TRINITY_DN44248_c0_g1~~TRINITY_DN44248_c0_g1_i1.p1  ORF type:complete len:385 (+),score=59.94 TRINITY_DN44248_c0_g1_i1:176-1330(+)